MDKILLVLSLFTLPGSVFMIAGLSDLSSVKDENNGLTYKIGTFLRFTSIFSLAFSILGIVAYFIK